VPPAGVRFVVAVVAAIGLIKFAIDSKDRWWRLILIVVVLGGIAAGLLWVFDVGRPGPHARAEPGVSTVGCDQVRRQAFSRSPSSRSSHPPGPSSGTRTSALPKAGESSMTTLTGGVRGSAPAAPRMVAKTSG
jgi:hypothetical protein